MDITWLLLLEAIPRGTQKNVAHLPRPLSCMDGDSGSKKHGKDKKENSETRKAGQQRLMLINCCVSVPPVSFVDPLIFYLLPEQ